MVTHGAGDLTNDKAVKRRTKKRYSGRRFTAHEFNGNIFRGPTARGYVRMRLSGLSFRTRKIR